MENKTAVMWLKEQLYSAKELDLEGMIEKALELNKQQIIDAYQWGRTDQNSKEKKWYNRNALIYYSETYKKPTE